MWHRIVTLFREPADGDNGRPVSQRAVLADLEQAPFTLKGGRGLAACGELLAMGILCSRSCPSRSGHDVPINLQWENVILSWFANLLSLYESESVMPKGLSLENVLTCVFQATANIANS